MVTLDNVWAKITSTEKKNKNTLIDLLSNLYGSSFSTFAPMKCLNYHVIIIEILLRYVISVCCLIPLLSALVTSEQFS